MRGVLRSYKRYDDGARRSPLGLGTAGRGVGSFSVAFSFLGVVVAGGAVVRGVVGCGVGGCEGKDLGAPFRRRAAVEGRGVPGVWCSTTLGAELGAR